MFMTVSLTVSAQDGYAVAPFFGERYSSNSNVSMVSLSGSQIKMKGLTKYKSMSVTGDAALSDKIAAAVGKDGSRAKSKEVSYKGGKLYFGFYLLKGGPNKRYLLFLDRRPLGKDKTTLIYLEGTLDPEEVKEMLK